MGVAEWRLKINQPSLFQFVRKQKRKEIIKRERVGGRNGGRELNHPDPKCWAKLEKQSGELELLGTQKEKGNLQSFWIVCSFQTTAATTPLPDMPVLGTASPLPSRGVGAVGIHPGVSPLQPAHTSEGRAEGISCAFSLSVKSNDFPTLRQSNPNPSPNGSGSGSGLGIWAPESAHLCLLSSFLFILAHNPGFYTPLSPPNRCPPGLCQIPLFPRTCREAAGKPAPGSRCLF